MYSLLKTLLIYSEGSDEEDCNSTLTQSWLPNLDGANDTSSEDEEQSRTSSSSKRIRKYKPLVIRKSTPKVQPKKKLSISTLAAPTSSSLLETNQSSGKSPLQKKEFSDALFNMGWLSPQPDPVPDSPPRPETPNRIESAQVVIRPLLDDMSTFNNFRTEKVTLNSGQVVLKSLQDEIQAYQTESGRKLHLPVDLKRKRCEADAKKSWKKERKQSESENQNMSKRLNENENELTMMELKLKKLERAKLDKTKLEESSQVSSVVHADPAEILNMSVKMDGNEGDESNDQFDGTQINKKDQSDCGVVGEASVVNENEREIDGSDQTENLPDTKKYSTQLSSDPPSYDSLKTWNMMTSEDSDSNLTFTNIKESQPDAVVSSFNAGQKYTPLVNAPSRDQVISTMEQYGIPSLSSGHPYWGNPKDEVKLKDVRGKSLVINSKLVRSLPEFPSSTSIKVSLLNKYGLLFYWSR